MYCIILHIHVPSSSDEIREDLEDVVTRLKPWVTPEGRAVRTRGQLPPQSEN